MVSLGSTEAEYVAVSEICKEVIFIQSILNFMGVVLELPIRILCDNVGAIFLSRNSESRRTKYIDTRYHFVRDYQENGIVMVEFVWSVENQADPFTKNLSVGKYERNFPYLMDL